MSFRDRLRNKSLELLIKQIPKFMKGSWRTTAVAWASALGIVAVQFVALFDTDPETIFSFEQLLVAAGLLGIGQLARDNKVTSSEAGAK